MFCPVSVIPVWGMCFLLSGYFYWTKASNHPTEIGLLEKNILVSSAILLSNRNYPLE
jgi:hypothetical protein